MFSLRTYILSFLLLFATGLSAQIFVGKGTTVTGAESIYVQGDDVVVEDGAEIQTEKININAQERSSKEEVASNTEVLDSNKKELAEAKEQDVAGASKSIQYTNVLAKRNAYHVPRQKNLDGSNPDYKEVQVNQAQPQGTWAHNLTNPTYWLVFTFDNSLNSNSYTHTKSKSYPHYSVLYTYENGTAILKPPTKEIS